MIEIATLSPDEQLELIERLWDSLSSTPNAVPFPDAHRQELDRRLDTLERDGPVGAPASEVLNRLGSRRT